MSTAIVAWVVIEVTLAFVVFCADTPGHHRRLGERLVRSVLWFVTLTKWFTHRDAVKLGRFGAVVWFLVTTSWLLTLEYDRLAMPAFVVLAEVTLGFVVYCVDALSTELQHRPARRLLRSALWMGPIAHYLSGDDSMALFQASVTVWVLLTTGWLLGVLTDRVAVPLAGLVS